MAPRSRSASPATSVASIPSTGNTVTDAVSKKKSESTVETPPVAATASGPVTSAAAEASKRFIENASMTHLRRPELASPTRQSGKINAQDAQLSGSGDDNDEDNEDEDDASIARRNQNRLRKKRPAATSTTFAGSSSNDARRDESSLASKKQNEHLGGGSAGVFAFPPASEVTDGNAGSTPSTEKRKEMKASSAVVVSLYSSEDFDDLPSLNSSSLRKRLSKSKRGDAKQMNQNAEDENENKKKGGGDDEDNEDDDCSARKGSIKNGKKKAQQHRNGSSESDTSNVFLPPSSDGECTNDDDDQSEGISASSTSGGGGLKKKGGSASKSKTGSKTKTFAKNSSKKRGGSQDKNYGGANGNEDDDEAILEIGLSPSENETEGVDEKGDDNEDDDDLEEFEVEKVLEHRKTRGGTCKYLLKWKGYPVSDSTWQDEKDLNCPGLIADYWEQKQAKEQAKSKVSTPARKSSTTTRSQRGELVSELPETQRKSTQLQSGTKRRASSPSPSTSTTGSTRKRGRPSNAPMLTSGSSSSVAAHVTVASDSGDEMESLKKKGNSGSSVGTEFNYTGVKEVEEPQVVELDTSLKSWVNLIEKIEALEGDEKSCTVIVTLKLKDGNFARYPSRTIREKCPDFLFDFYEKHLKFQTSKK